MKGDERKQAVLATYIYLKYIPEKTSACSRCVSSDSALYCAMVAFITCEAWRPRLMPSEASLAMEGMTRSS